MAQWYSGKLQACHFKPSNKLYCTSKVPLFRVENRRGALGFLATADSSAPGKTNHWRKLL